MRLRWAILGTGNIARQFARGIAQSDRGEIVAVGSRSRSSAELFTAEVGTEAQIFESYAGAVESPAADAVYVSLPNSLHHEWTIRALRAGKHVLCEKPFATNTAQAEEMFEVARSTGRLAMEAFMYRSHPQTLAVLDAVRSGAIGKVRLIRTSFCFRTSKIAGNIRFDPALAGGAIMDIGCYCVHFARLFAGAEPEAIQAIGQLHPNGIDELTAGTLRFPGGVIATFNCGMIAQADNTATICGSDGYIEIPVPWKPAVEGSRFSIVRQTPPVMDGNPRPLTPPRETIEVPGGKNLYALEADDFAAAVFGEKPPSISAADTLGNMRVLDEIRRQVGLSF